MGFKIFRSPSALLFNSMSTLLQVLDAPSLQDDFYLNLVDWSSQNVLAVGLGTCVYLWSASNSKVSSKFYYDLNGCFHCFLSC